MSPNLQTSLEEGVLRVTLNRPEKRNALSFALCRELVGILAGAERDPGVGAILLGASGDVFCAGMDLEEALEAGAAEHAAVHEDLFTIGARLSLPIVAAISGPALGGGMGLVANSHVAVAVQGGSFGLTEIRLGMWPFVVFRAVTLAIGERRALELSLTGRIFGTQEALQWGFVQHVVPAFELDDRAWSIAAGLAASSRETIRRGMQFVQQARGLEPRAAGELAFRARTAQFESPDFLEGVAAFKEKRKPKWANDRGS